MSGAYLFILIRCIYRIGEMAGGWKNKISRNQTDFMVLDGLMCILAAIAMTFAHPGIWFPKMQQAQDGFESISARTGTAKSKTSTAGTNVGLANYSV